VLNGLRWVQVGSGGYVRNFWDSSGMAFHFTPTGSFTASIEARGLT